MYYLSGKLLTIMDILDPAPTSDSSLSGRAIVILLLLAIACSAIGAYLGSLVAGSFGISDLSALVAAEEPQSLDLAQRNGLRWYNLITHLFVFSVSALLTALIVARSTTWQFLQLDRFPLAPKLVWLLLIVLAVFPLMQVVYWLNQQLPLPQWMWDMESQQGWLVEEVLRMESPVEFALAFLVAAVAPAIGEELLFRGVLQPRISDLSRNPHLAVWLTAILFSAIHMQFAGFLPRMLLGALLGYLLVWTRSLWVPILAHLLFNGIQIVAVYFMGDAIDMESAATPSWSSCLLSLPALALLLWAIRKLRD